MKPNKKGFTIVEIVISLLVIAIVSVTATSVVLSGQRIQRDARDKFFAANYCNNFTAIFQAAASENYDSESPIADMVASFCAGVNELLGIQIPASSEEEGEAAEPITEYHAEIYFDSNWVPATDGGKFTCFLTFAESDDGLVTFTVNMIGGREVCSSTYTMPLGGAL